MLGRFIGTCRDFRRNFGGIRGLVLFWGGFERCEAGTFGCADVDRRAGLGWRRFQVEKGFYTVTVLFFRDTPAFLAPPQVPA